MAMQTTATIRRVEVIRLQRRRRQPTVVTTLKAVLAYVLAGPALGSEPTDLERQGADLQGLRFQR